MKENVAYDVPAFTNAEQDKAAKARERLDAAWKKKMAVRHSAKAARLAGRAEERAPDQDSEAYLQKHKEEQKQIESSIAETKPSSGIGSSVARPRPYSSSLTSMFSLSPSSSSSSPPESISP